MRHGRYVCKAQKPDCPRCIIRDLCEFRAKTVDPEPATKKAARSRGPRAL